MEILNEQVNIELQKILNATQETEYYKQYFSSASIQKRASLNLSDFPILTYQDVQKEGSRFLCGRYHQYPDISNLLLKRCFGLFGIPHTVYWDIQDDACSQAFLRKYRKEQFDIAENEKGCMFCVAQYAGNKIMDYTPMSMSQDGKIMSLFIQDLTNEKIKWCLEAIYKFNPAWLCLSPSIALMLIDSMVINQKSMPSSLRYIELYGEILDECTENIIKDFFHVQIGNVYATKAAGIVAVSCIYGHLHILERNAVVEIIRHGKSVLDEEGDVCITSLQNTAMPLVRLRNGDKGMVQSIPCPCGQASLRLCLTQGKRSHFIITKSGRRISARILRSIAEYTNEEISRCLSYIQFRQMEHNRMDIILGVKPAFSGWEHEAARIFIEKLQDPELKQMYWNFIYDGLDKDNEIAKYEHLFFESMERKDSDAE